MGPLGSPGPTVRAQIHPSLVLTETFWQQPGLANQKCSQETDKELLTALFIIAMNWFDQQEETACIHTVKIRFSKNI